MADFIITRDIATYSTQRILVVADSEDEAYRLSSKDDADAITIIDETNVDTFEINNNEIKSPQEAFQEIQALFDGFRPYPLMYGNHSFRDKEEALEYYRQSFHLPPA
jgi:hypothetical protein